jgi:uncharacterized coiled-coil protein SlyX
LKRIVPVLLILAACAVPSFAFAGDGAQLDARLAKLEARVATYESRCEVANAPARCAQVKTRLGAVIDKMQARLQGRVNTINQRCSATPAPRRCAAKSDVLARLNQALSRLASLESRLA